MKIQIINGPNLNLLGKREPEVYGSQSFDAYLMLLKEKFSSIQLNYFQSNIEGEIIDKIHETGFDYDGIILNAGAYTHTSIAIGDAIKAISAPVIEVHISNVYSREEFRHVSHISSSCKGTISGFGMNSYSLAVSALIEIIGTK
ncbi:MAG: type II 3-dehydroquinate dehydratase [Dysgonamonadaceae bacterium]|nr:type II 3-dehydroquinate dehydratase [Dysgonamonadaceae bacterium]MDD4727599.1 type II 3-dehydroquinate dehydratase [Dysgonamonadaceae bacterium]